MKYTHYMVRHLISSSRIRQKAHLVVSFKKRAERKFKRIFLMEYLILWR